MAKQALQKTPASRTSLCFKEEDFENSLQMSKYSERCARPERLLTPVSSLLYVNQYQ